jgi:hypothetical protein
MLQHGSATATQLAHLVYLVIGIRVCAASSREGSANSCGTRQVHGDGSQDHQTIHQTAVDLSRREIQAAAVADLSSSASEQDFFYSKTVPADYSPSYLHFDFGMMEV